MAQEITVFRVTPDCYIFCMMTVKAFRASVTFELHTSLAKEFSVVCQQTLFPDALTVQQEQRH